MNNRKCIALGTAIITALSSLLLTGCGSNDKYEGKTVITMVQYKPEAVEAFEYIARTEGIICAIESAHAVAHVIKTAKNYSKDDIIIVCLSGRGDKDVAAIARYRGIDLHE